MINIEPKVFVGPMSKNVVDACIEFSNKNNTPLGFIPSRRQIDYDSGYVNNWKTESFANYVKKRSKNILIQRDHGGCNQGDVGDDGFESFLHDAKNFDLIHIDPFKKSNSLEDGARYTVEVIKRLDAKNCLFEIGTEEALFRMSVDDCRRFLDLVSSGVGANLFERVRYFVVQFGTKLDGNKNTGIFDIERAMQMINVCKEYDKKSKEHNGDYLSKEDVKVRRKLGLEAINVAPEMGGIESRCIMDQINDDTNLFNCFVKCCKSTNRWQKWFPYNQNPNEKELLESCGHYCFSLPEFDELKNKIDFDVVKRKTFDMIAKRLGDLTQ